MIHFHIISLFPESIDGYFKSSIMKRAIENNLITVSFYNPRDYTDEKWARVDRRPYGGGPGMVLEPEAILRAIDAAVGKEKAEVIFFSTHGDLFSENIARSYAPTKGKKVRDIVFICGHYEGVDERVATITKARKVSLGEYVLTGGELGATIMIDAITRFVPGVLGNSNSLENLRISDHTQEPKSVTSSPVVYTRPEVLTWKRKKYPVPDVLRSGNHAEIEKWKKENKNGG